MKVRARFVIVALIAIGLFAVMRGYDGISGASPQILPLFAAGRATSNAREPSTSAQALPALPQANVVTLSLPSDTSRKVAATRDGDVSVGLSAEPNQNPNIGDVFRLAIDTDSHRPVGRFTVTVNYNPLMLRLVGVRSSEFVVHPMDLANFTVRTPASTEGQIIVSWDGRAIAGTGVLGLVEFELYASGSTEITLSDIEVVDVQGLAIQVADPEPVRVERHLS